MRKKRVLCLFDYVARTGFGTVSKNIVSELKKSFGSDIHLDIVAINYFGEHYWEDENTYIIPAKTSDAKADDYGRYLFLKILKESNDYDGIFICQDLGVIVPFIEVMQHIKKEKKDENRKSFKSIFYFPVDCHLVQELTRNLDFFDVLVTYTEFGRKEVLKHKPSLKVKVVPHGNNSKDFYPLKEDEILEFRKEFFGDNANKFIVTNINRNQPRKDIPNTIFGFIEARKIWDKELPPPFLYLHCHPQDPMGWDIRGIMLQTDMVEDVDYKLLPKEFEESMADTEIVNKIYNASDVFLTTTLGEGWGLCLHPSTYILTIEGAKKIKDIVKGDLVMANDGLYHDVLDTTCRTVSSYIQVDTKYGFNVRTTHEHPFYSIKDGVEEWRNIEELNVGDYLAIVKPKDISELPTLDLADYMSDDSGFLIDDLFIYSKYGYSPNNKKWSLSSICEKYSTTKKVAENSISYISGNKVKVSERALLLSNDLIADGFIKPNPLKINRIIDLNNDLLWVFGWYLAEGSCEAGKRIEFSMCKDEVYYANKISEIIKKYFGVKDIVVRVYENKCAVRVSSVALANIFRNLFGDGAYNKKIPSILLNCKKSLMPLVNGYIQGDGYTKLDNNLISFSTISPSLAYQIQHTLSCNSVMVSIKKTFRKSSNYDIYIGTISNCHLRRYMDLVSMEGVLRRENTRNHKPDFIETENHFFVPIKKISEINETSEMYDLCVEGSHSFIGNGLVCHNTYGESAACKLPIVAPYTTSFMEMSNYGKDAYMLTSIYPYCHTNDNVIREQTDIYEIADTLMKVCVDKKEYNPDLQSKIDRSYNWVKKLEWKEVCKSWVEYFKIF